MKRNKLTYIMIKSAIEKGIRDIQVNPERGIRNLVDLGDMFTTGKIQKDFFKIAEEELQNSSSAYYKLIEKVACGTDARLLTELGINIGYYCWSLGAKRIRELEAKMGFNIPWTIFFDFSSGSYPLISTIKRIISQGTDLGIFCYMFHIDSATINMPALLDLFAAYPDCAYLLFIHPSLVNSDLLSSVLKQKTISVQLDLQCNAESTLKNAATLLSDNHILTGGYLRYSKGFTLSDGSTLLQPALNLGLPFLFLLRKEKCHPLSDSIQNDLNHIRLNLKAPVFPIDLFDDIAAIDRNISSEACLLTVAGSEQIVLSDMEAMRNKGGFNINLDLSDILSSALPKTDRSV